MGGWPDNQLMTQATKYNVSYQVVVEGDWELMLRNTSAQTVLINNCVNLLKTTNGAGINLDYEGMPAEYKDEYNTFVANLYKALNPLGKKLSLAVGIDINGWPGGLDDVFFIFSFGWFILYGI